MPISTGRQSIKFLIKFSIIKSTLLGLRHHRSFLILERCADSFHHTLILIRWHCSKLGFHPTRSRSSSEWWLKLLLWLLSVHINFSHVFLHKIFFLLKLKLDISFLLLLLYFFIHNVNSTDLIDLLNTGLSGVLDCKSTSVGLSEGSMNCFLIKWHHIDYFSLFINKGIHWITRSRPRVIVWYSMLIAKEVMEVPLRNHPVHAEFAFELSTLMTFVAHFICIIIIEIKMHIYQVMFVQIISHF